MQELRQSRARIVRAGDDERRKLERNLHDGVQQRLVAIRIDLGVESNLAAGDPAKRSRLDGIGQSVEVALDEVREVSHGLYPPVLSDWGLVTALERIQLRADAPLRCSRRWRRPTRRRTGIRRLLLLPRGDSERDQVRRAVGARRPLTLREARTRFASRLPTMAGLRLVRRATGHRLQNMHDRLGALDGRLTIVTAPGHGTVVRAGFRCATTSATQARESLGPMMPTWSRGPTRTSSTCLCELVHRTVLSSPAMTNGESRRSRPPRRACAPDQSQARRRTERHPRRSHGSHC